MTRGPSTQHPVTSAPGRPCLHPSQAVRKILALFAVIPGLVAALLAHPALAQERVVNGSFSLGDPAGWTVQGGYIGYVSYPGSESGGIGSWIGVGEALEQELETVPGQVYLLGFATQTFDPSQSWRPNFLEVSWDGENVAHFGFQQGDTRWYRPRFHLRATGTRTRLRFSAVNLSSLDIVSVRPRTNALLLGRTFVDPVPDGFMEGQSLDLTTDWLAGEEPASVGQQNVYLNGTRLIGQIPSGTNRFRWTNLPPGVHVLSTEFAFTRSVATRITVATRPKIQLLSPTPGSVHEPGATVTLRAAVIDNGGRIHQVRFLVGDSELTRLATGSTDGTFDTTWIAGPEGSYRVTAVAEGADGQVLDTAVTVVSTLPAPVVDQQQDVYGVQSLITPGSPVAQIFRPRLSGRLHSVDLELAHNNGFLASPVTVSLNEVQDGLPNTNRLASVSVPLPLAYLSPTTSTRARFHFTNGPTVVSGRTYALVVETQVPAGNETSIRTSTLDSLRSGFLLVRTGGVWRRPDSVSALDLVFISYVIPRGATEVALSTPTEGSSSPAGTPIPLRAEVSPNQGGHVDFLANGVQVARANDFPFESVWASPPMGTHVLQAIWTSEDGEVVLSPPVRASSGPGDPLLPVVGIAETRSREGDSSLPPLVFHLTLDRTSTSTVQVPYSTQDVTARADDDYLPSAGIATFAPGQTSRFIFVRLLADLRPTGYRRMRLILGPPTGAVLGQVSATGTILEDDLGPGMAAALKVRLGTNSARLGDSIPATVGTLDLEGRPFSTLPWPARLEWATSRGEVVTVQPEPQSISGAYPPGVTIGHRLRSTRPLLITHVRSPVGGQASIWNEEGRRLGTVALPSPSPGAWTEVALGRPVLVPADRRFRISLHTPSGSMPYSYRPPSTPEWVVESATCEGFGDVFPAGVSYNVRPLLDFRFQSLHSASARPDPDEVQTGPNGEWTGSLRADVAGDPVYLIATDPHGILLPDIARLRIPLDPGIRLSFHLVQGRGQLGIEAPKGRRLLLQSSQLAGPWTDRSPVIQVGAEPFVWSPGPQNFPQEQEFFRAILLE